MSILSNKVRVGTVGITVAAMFLAALPACAAVPSNTSPSESRIRADGGSPLRSVVENGGLTEERTGKASKQENIGVLTGLAVGAAAGGPIGAMAGMVAGAWLGNRYHREIAANHTLVAQNQALTASLGRSEEVREGLAGKLTLASRSLAAVEAQRAELDRMARLSDDIETDVTFKTADASINRLELPALRKIGALAASLPPGAKVRVDGYADPRGPATLNDDLSLQRAEAVALALEQAGCPQGRLVIEGHGSLQSARPRGDLDEYAFDRRVTVRLDGTSAVARLSELPGVPSARVSPSGPEVADAGR